MASGPHQATRDFTVTAHQWLLFLPAATLVAASPGARNFLALNNGLRRGLRPADTALFGRLLAFAIIILIVILGAGALLATSATAFAVLKWLGVALSTRAKLPALAIRHTPVSSGQRS